MIGGFLIFLFMMIFGIMAMIASGKFLFTN